jgi:hypothetical protein
MQPRWMRRSVLALALTLIGEGGGTIGIAVGGVADRPADAFNGGIWKAVVPPPGSMHGEFDNDDPVGLAAGVSIPADCSINWTDPDAGRLYCFSSATSLVFFLDAPHAYLERARAQWLHLRASRR